MKKWKKVLIISSLCTLAGAFTVLAAPNYDNIAVSKVSGSVNIRTEANTTSAVTGKIQNHCAAEILETVDVRAENGIRSVPAPLPVISRQSILLPARLQLPGQRKWDIPMEL